LFFNKLLVEVLVFLIIYSKKKSMNKKAAQKKN